jgi:hypothetical protein
MVALAVRAESRSPEPPVATQQHEMNSPVPESAQAAAGAPTRPRAELVLAREGAERRYAMFEVRELSPGGAVLEGGLLLEMDEELTVDLVLDEDAPVRVHARVVGLLRELPAVAVRFPELGERDRTRVENRALTESPSNSDPGATNA